MSRRKTLIALFVVPVVLLLSVISVSVATAGTTHQAKAQIATPTITIQAFSYKVPASVLHGALVKVVNKDSVAHTVTSNRAGKFNVSVPAHSSRSFHAPGTPMKYGFHCTIHPQMTGVLKVR
jgi:plastocyanin